MYPVLEIMSRRTSLPANSEWAMQILNQEYDQFDALFRSFFAEMIEYVENDFGIRIARP
jgi:acyl carrier protein phosphodiesterase